MMREVPSTFSMHIHIRTVCTELDLRIRDDGKGPAGPLATDETIMNDRTNDTIRLTIRYDTSNDSYDAGRRDANRFCKCT